MHKRAVRWFIRGRAVDVLATFGRIVQSDDRWHHSPTFLRRCGEWDTTAGLIAGTVSVMDEWKIQ